MTEVLVAWKGDGTRDPATFVFGRGFLKNEARDISDLPEDHQDKLCNNITFECMNDAALKMRRNATPLHEPMPKAEAVDADEAEKRALKDKAKEAPKPDKGKAAK